LFGGLGQVGAVERPPRRGEGDRVLGLGDVAAGDGEQAVGFAAGPGYDDHGVGGPASPLVPETRSSQSSEVAFRSWWSVERHVGNDLIGLAL
jgi:hypothetical protein